MAACKAAGLTASGLAAELKVSRQYLVNAATRKGHSMAALRAKEIERIVGFTGWPKITQPKVPSNKLVYSGERMKLRAAVSTPAEAPVARESKRRALH